MPLKSIQVYSMVSICKLHPQNVTLKFPWTFKKEEKKPGFQFSSVQSRPTLCDPMNRSTPGLPVHHQLPEFTHTHVHRVGDAIQLSQASLSITNSRSSLTLTSIELVMPSSYLILCRPLSFLPPIPPSVSLFQALRKPKSKSNRGESTNSC